MTFPTLTIWTLRLLAVALLYRGVTLHSDVIAVTAYGMILLTIAYRAVERREVKAWR